MKKIPFLIAVAALATAASAKETTTCSTDKLTNGQLPLSDQREFVCGNGMRGTIPDLTKQGWSVGAVWVRTDGANQTFIVLKKD